MKLNYKKPAVNSLTDPKAGFPAALMAGAAVLSAAANIARAVGRLDYKKGRKLVDRKEFPSQLESA